MTEFDAYYYDNKFYIGGSKEYALGEILTKFLSKNFKDLDYYLRRCRDYMVLLRYPEERSEAENCDEFFHTAMRFFSEIESIKK